MKVLFDTNVWVSALIARGLCADLVRVAMREHGWGEFELLICEAVCTETLRILRDKLAATEDSLRDVQSAMALAQMVAGGGWTPPGDFPDADDVPIVSAALTAGADWLVTGDRALLTLGEIHALRIIDPRTAYEYLRGLR